MIVDFINLSRRWKSKIQHPIRRNLALILIGCFHLLIFTAAGIFSSRVASTGDQVLIRSKNCGWLADDVTVDIPANQSLKDALDALWISGRQSARETLSYNAACYTTETTSTPSPCETFVQRRIESKINRAAACPFEGNACDMSHAVELDSGYIDSSTHLGINTPASERIAMRRVTTCSVVPAEEKFAMPWANVTSSALSYPTFQNDAYRAYNLGSSISPISYYYGQGVSNHTVTISNSTIWNQNNAYQLW
jgi:hypothetical protein